ncbi:hypothetical protein ACFX2J_037514 [Malus domestica]
MLVSVPFLAKKGWQRQRARKRQGYARRQSGGETDSPVRIRLFAQLGNPFRFWVHLVRVSENRSLGLGILLLWRLSRRRFGDFFAMLDSFDLTQDVNLTQTRCHNLTGITFVRVGIVEVNLIFRISALLPRWRW